MEMDKYIKELELRNELLQEELSKSLSEVKKITDVLKKEHYYTINLNMKVFDHIISVETIHMMFPDAISACKNLKKNWKVYKNNFATMYKPNGFAFKFFSIESYNGVHWEYDKKRIEPSRAYSWGFEAIKEVEETIKILKK